MIVNAWLAKGVVIAGIVGLLAIPASIHRKREKWNVSVSNRDWLERSLLAINSVAFLLQLLWLASPWLRFADYPLHPLPFGAGIMCLVVGLWKWFKKIWRCLG